MTSKKKTKKKSPRSRKKTVKRKKRVAKAAPSVTNGANGHAPWTPTRIVALRNKLHLTQEQFAQKIGVTYVSVNRWENGKVTPKGLSLKVLESLEAAA